MHQHKRRIRYEEMARTKGASMTMLATDQEKHEQVRWCGGWVG